MDTWKTEEEDVLEYKTKAHLVLESSRNPGNTWGIVKDCHGNINMIPKDADVVGTWARYTDGEYWVSLETPIQALQDRATVLIAEMAEKRRQQEAERVPVTARVSKPRTKKTTEPEISAESAIFDDLRSRLKGAS